MALIVFIIVLAVLVLSHEFGHFIAAKRSGIKVEEFGFGFPPRLFSIQKGETLYSFNLLPLGGFVRVEGEDDAPIGPRSFNAQPFYKRALVLLAGVGANVILAFFLFTLGAWMGIPWSATAGDAPGELSNIRVLIVEVIPNSPAEASGLTAGDVVTEIGIDGKREAIDSIDEFRELMRTHAGTPVTLYVGRGGDTSPRELIPRMNPPEGEGAAGVALETVGLLKTPWYEAPIKGLQETVTVTWEIVKFLGVLLAAPFRDAPSAAGDVTGPIGIYFVISQSFAIGIAFLIRITALISLNLAVLNVLPIPALDGGRLAFLIVERIRGKAFQPHIPRLAHTVGFITLILLVIIITYRDIIRFF